VFTALANALTLVGICWWHHWISGATMLCLIAVALLASQSTVAKSSSRRVADVAQLIYYRDVLPRQVAELQRNGASPAVAAIAVDGFGSMTSGIALDPTGEILLKPDRRSKSWMATAGQTEIGIESLSTAHSGRLLLVVPLLITSGAVPWNSHTSE